MYSWPPNRLPRRRTVCHVIAAKEQLLHYHTPITTMCKQSIKKINSYFNSNPALAGNRLQYRLMIRMQNRTHIDGP
jgi:hypothetical protein